MKTLYLHIGTHKTATTSLQLFLKDNNEVLKSKGYIYPDFPFKYPYIHEHRNGLFLGNLYIGMDGERDEEREKRYFSEGLNIVHDIFRTYDNIVISNERMWLNFFRGKAYILKKLVEDSKKHGYRIVMIIYLRRQDQFIESYWNELIKSNFNESRTLEEYVHDFKRLNYYKILDTFAGLIGEENLIVRRFQGLDPANGIMSDFLQQIGLTLTDEYAIPDEQFNSGLSGNVTEIKRIINQMGGLDRDAAVFFKYGLQLSSKPSSQNYKCSELSEEERAELMSKYEKGNALIAERFIRDGKPLFSDDYSCAPKREAGNSEYLNDIIRSLAGVDIILSHRVKELEQKTEDLQLQLEKQSRRIDHLRHPVRALLSRNPHHSAD